MESVDMQYVDILFGFLALVAMFTTQVYLVKRITAFVKDMSGLQGNNVRLLAFCVGVAIGVVFLWPWVVMNPGYHISIYVLTSVLFLIVAGLTASGDYDFEKEKEIRGRSRPLDEEPEIRGRSRPL